MEHYRKLTTQQLVMALCCATLVGATMLSHDSKLAFIPLAFSALAAIGVAAKFRGR